MSEIEMKYRHKMVTQIKAKLTDDDLDFIEYESERLRDISYRRGLKDAFLVCLVASLSSMVLWYLA